MEILPDRLYPSAATDRMVADMDWLGLARCGLVIPGSGGLWPENLSFH